MSLVWVGGGREGGREGGRGGGGGGRDDDEEGMQALLTSASDGNYSALQEPSTMTDTQVRVGRGMEGREGRVGGREGTERMTLYVPEANGTLQALGQAFQAPPPHLPHLQHVEGRRSGGRGSYGGCRQCLVICCCCCCCCCGGGSDGSGGR